MDRIVSSKYTIAVERDNNVILFSALTKKMILISIEDFYAMKSKDYEKIENKGLIDTLLKNNFYVHEKVNETNILHKILNKHKFPNEVYIYIEITSQCNINCYCCYQKAKFPSNDDKLRLGKFNEVTFTNIKKLIVNLHDKLNLSNLTIMWSGGEPLLYHNIIRTYNEKFRELSKTISVTYRSELTTNGLQLLKNDSIINKLNVDQYYFTLNGVDNPIHHLDLHYINDRYKALKLLINKEAKVQVIYHVDKYSVNKVDEILKILKHIDIQGIFFIHIRDVRGHISLKNDSDKIFTRKEYTQVYPVLLKKCAKYKIPIKTKLGLRSDGGNICSSSYPTVISVTPNGELFRGACMKLIGLRNRKIDIKDYDPYLYGKKYSIKNIYKQCLHCRLLPICGNHFCEYKVESISDFCGNSINDFESNDEGLNTFLFDYCKAYFTPKRNEVILLNV